MATWTNMKVKNLVTFEWANSIKTHVTCKTLEGRTMTESVNSLKTKVNDPNLLRPIRSIFQDMLDWAEQNK